MENQLRCMSCRQNITNQSGNVKFKCPKCSKFEIIRCKHCREIAAAYKCPECGFTGPN
ncbi:MAG: zinc finger domain-containing protein [Candidatus Woesearchaeota archaeon]|nr:zinc finger domain-containing protein [Candidatus Woesearchaeota archaeon]MDP7324444.1 zinc finger domain-containing protein [Candidatus Woesearchaeota archaeon]